jgi:ArsR family transcriptional regulator, arsenate/arsenite/antimonite-responsive transcriptional repressor
MKKSDALEALAGLSHETRLDIYRLLVEAGPSGMPAGRIAERLRLAPPTLSFHLNHLQHAGLVDHERDGRWLIYAADFGRVRDLIAYLTENCCAGQPEACGLPGCEPAALAGGSAAKAASRARPASRGRRA